MSKSENRPCGVYEIGGIVIDTVKEEKDLRITTQDTLTPEKPINKISEGTFSLQAKYQTGISQLRQGHDEEKNNNVYQTKIREWLFKIS